MPDLPFLQRTQADVIRWRVSQAKKQNPHGIMRLSLYFLGKELASVRRPQHDGLSDTFGGWLSESREWESTRDLERFRDLELLGRHVRDYLG